MTNKEHINEIEDINFLSGYAVSKPSRAVVGKNLSELLPLSQTPIQGAEVCDAISAFEKAAQITQ